MKTRLTALCLTMTFVFLTACGHSSVSDISTPTPSSRPGSQPPAIESQAPTAGPESPAVTISLDEYREMVSALNAEILEESELLLRLGLYEYNWWGAYPEGPETADLAATTEVSMARLSEEFGADADTLASACNRLIADYADIVYAAVDGEVSAEVSGPLDTLVSAYYKLYTIVIEPSGTMQDFASMLCSCTHSITTSSAELTSALESDPLTQVGGAAPSDLICLSTAIGLCLACQDMRPNCLPSCFHL